MNSIAVVARHIQDETFPCMDASLKLCHVFVIKRQSLVVKMSTIHMARCPGALHIQIHFLMAYEDVARQQFLLWIVSCCHVINEKF